MHTTLSVRVNFYSISTNPCACNNYNSKTIYSNCRLPLDHIMRLGQKTEGFSPSFRIFRVYVTHKWITSRMPKKTYSPMSCA